MTNAQPPASTFHASCATPEDLATTGHMLQSSAYAVGLAGSLGAMSDLIEQHLPELEKVGPVRMAALKDCPVTGRTVTEHALLPRHVVLLHMLAPGLAGQLAREVILKTLEGHADAFDRNAKAGLASFLERLEADRTALPAT